MASGRDRMIESINLLTGRRDCTEAVMVQQRPAWALASLPAAVLLVVVLEDFDLRPITIGVAAGAVAFFGFTSRTTYWLIGRTATHVVIARSSARRAKALEIAHALPHPVPVTVTPGVLQLKIFINGQRYYLARFFERRFRSIVAGVAPARGTRR